MTAMHTKKLYLYVKSTLFAFMFFGLIACDTLEQEVAAAVNASNDEGEKIWVFTQFNVPEEGDKIESYYYFGEVSESLYSKIKNNQVSTGYLELKNVRYWGSDDLIHEYRDAIYDGNLLFRIEHNVRISVLRAAPIVGKGDEQFDEITEDEPQAQTSSLRSPDSE